MALAYEHNYRRNTDAEKRIETFKSIFPGFSSLQIDIHGTYYILQNAIHFLFKLVSDLSSLSDQKERAAKRVGHARLECH